MRTRVSSTRMIPILAILVAIGCGGGKPQEASATSESLERPTQAPMQLAKDVASPAQSAQEGGGSIEGTVMFSGEPPAPKRIKMDADPQCSLQHPDPAYSEEVVINPNGTLKNVFVYIAGGLEGQEFPTPSGTVVLDQQGCSYHPHVLGLQVSQSLEIRNSDATLHNVNCKSKHSKGFNIAQPIKGMKSSKKFTAAEIMVACKCNVHPWMATYIGVVEHPFFSVTDDEGQFRISGLPAGRYTVEAWHERYGTQSRALTVEADGTASLELIYTAE